jgi:hypothetical protein
MVRMLRDFPFLWAVRKEWYAYRTHIFVTKYKEKEGIADFAKIENPCVNKRHEIWMAWFEDIDFQNPHLKIEKAPSPKNNEKDWELIFSLVKPSQIITHLIVVYNLDNRRLVKIIVGKGDEIKNGLLRQKALAK